MPTSIASRGTATAASPADEPAPQQRHGASVGRWRIWSDHRRAITARDARRDFIDRTDPGVSRKSASSEHAISLQSAPEPAPVATTRDGAIVERAAGTTGRRQRHRRRRTTVEAAITPVAPPSGPAGCGKRVVLLADRAAPATAMPLFDARSPDDPLQHPVASAKLRQ